MRGAVDLKVIVEVFTECRARCAEFGKVSVPFFIEGFRVSDWLIDQLMCACFKAGSLPAVILIGFWQTAVEESQHLLHNKM